MPETECGFWSNLIIAARDVCMFEREPRRASPCWPGLGKQERLLHTLRPKVDLHCWTEAGVAVSRAPQALHRCNSELSCTFLSLL